MDKKQEICANSIVSNVIQTRINTNAWETPEALEKLMKLIPYDRIGQLEDTGAAVV